MFPRLLLVLTLALFLPVFLLTGCGGGSSKSNTPSGVTLKGAAQKGLFTELVVKAYPLDENTGLVDTTKAVIATTEDSDYQLTLPDEGLYLLEATGTFIDETTGEPVLLTIPLESLVEVDQLIQDSNINLLTHLFSSLVIDSLQEGISLDESETAAREFITQSLGLDQDTDFTTLDITAIQPDSTLDDPNLRLLLFSSAILQQLPDTGTLVDFGAVIDSFIQATDTTALQDIFSSLEGSGAQALYDQAQDANPDLPDLSFLQDNMPVYVCDLEGCSWQFQTRITASLVATVLLEADGYATFTVQLSAAADTQVEVDIQTVSQTAVAGRDFVSVQQRILFQPGETTRKITLPVLLDNQTEVAEYFEVQIVSVTEGYGITNGTIQVALTEGLGKSDLNLSTDQVSIESVCVSAVGDGNAIAPADCLGNALVAIPETDEAALTMNLAMAVACEGLSCEPWKRDWAVEFVLEAFSVETDLRGNQTFTVEDSNIFARHRFPGSHLIRSGEETQSYALYAHIDKGFRDLDSKATANSWHLRIKARLLGLDAVAAITGFSSPLVLPTTLQAGDRSLPFHVSSIQSGSSQGVCASGEYQISAEFSLDGSVFQDSIICALLDEASNTLTLANGQVNIAGSRLELPAFHSTFHRLDGKRPDVRGLPYLIVPDPSAAEPQLYIHTDGLPVAFPLSEVFVDTQGLKIKYDHVYYLQAGEFSRLDARRNAVTSNDIQFQTLYQNTLEGQGIYLLHGEMVLTENGIQTILPMPAGNGRYAFPEGEITWGGFQLRISSGRISATPVVLPDVNFTLEQNGRCSGLQCVDELTELHQVSGNLYFGGQGAMVGNVHVNPGAASQPRWGAIPGTDASAFTRPDDLPDNATAVLSLPGYVFDDEPDSGLDASLYSHQAYTSEIISTPLLGDINRQSISRYPLGSSQALEGNQWPTGITVGPEYYADLTNGGVPVTGTGRSLNGSRLVLNNGVDNAFDLNVNAGAKYVIRNAGITGVFNIDDQELLNPISFYGYQLNFDRFAFRLVDNAMDDYSWIDGKLRVPDINDALPANASVSAGAAGFDLQFVSLQLDCDGSFAAANPIPDPTRPQSLTAWNAATDIYAMSFERSTSNRCEVAPRVLTLDQTLEMKALDNPVALDNVEWLSDGSVGGSRVVGGQEFILDGSQNHSGFGVHTATGRLQTLLGNQLYGVLKLDNAQQASYLWTPPRVDIRLSNNSLKAESSVVVSHGLIDQGDALTNSEFNVVDNTDYDLTMKYNWGNTRYGFDLPVYYSSGDSLTAPRFTGRYKKSDLLVLEAGAGIDYIEAEKTRLSFGLSADIAKIQELPLSLDLGDAISIQRLDGLLSQAGLGSIGLSTLLEPLQSKLETISSIGGSALEQTLRNTLDDKINQQFSGDILTLTQSLSLAQSLPNQLLAVLANETQSVELEDVGMNVVDLRSQLQAFQQTLSSINSVDQLAEFELANQQLTDLLAALQRLRAQTDALFTQFRHRVNQSISLIDQAEQHLQALNQALNAISGSNGVTAIFQLDSTTCLDGSLTVDNAGHLTPVVELNTNIEGLINDFSVLNVASGLGGLSMGVGEDLQNLLENTQRLIQSQARVLQLEWDGNNGIPALRASLCNEQSINYTQDMDAFLTGLQGQNASLLEFSQQLSAELEIIKQTLASYVITNSIVNLNEYFDLAIQLLSLAIEVELQANDWNGTLVWQNINTRYAQLVENYPGDIEVLLATGGSAQVDFVNGLVFPVLAKFQVYPEELRGVIQDAVTISFPGAYFDPESFRRMLINRIMQTVAMNELRNRVQQFAVPYMEEISSLNLNLTDHINAIIKRALSAVNPQVNDLLHQASGVLPEIPLKSVGMDGFAEFRGYDLSRIHIDAGWEMDKQIGGVAGPSFSAALDILAANAGEDAMRCETLDSVKSFDVSISARDVNASLFGDGTTLDLVHLDFTLAEGGAVLAYKPVAIGGGLSMTGEVEYAGFSLFDFGFEAALGRQEVYIGAGGSGSFDTTALSLNAFFGRTCEDTTLKLIDPASASLLPFDGGPFTGLYLRGDATVPIISSGCPLDLSARVSVGSWITLEPIAEVGGILGGGVLGSVACIGSVRGQVDAVASVNTDGDVYFAGQAFAVAGAGADCDRHTWTSVGRSRNDDWCGTADINVGVRFQDNQWDYDPGHPSAIH